MNFTSLADMTIRQSPRVVDEMLLQGPSSYTLPPPLAVHSDEDAHELQVFWAFETGRRCTFPPIRMVCLRDVYLSPEGLVFFDDGNCLLETIYPLDTSNVAARFPRLANVPEWLTEERAAADEIDEAVHLREPGEAGYFHWINSVLPRMAVVQRFFRISQLPLGVALGKAFASQSAKLIGIDTANVLAAKTGYRCRKLWVFSPTIVRGDHFTRAKFWTQEVRRLLLTGQSQSAGRRVYLSRQDASVRAIVNEAALVRLLERFGFESLTVGAMPFADQVASFGAADVLLSAHGAGLSNAIFMHQGTVIEIVPRTRLWPTFRTLAERAGLSYAAFISATVAGNGVPVPEGNEGIEVNLIKFERFLSEILC